MGKRLPLITVLLVGASIAFAVLIVKELTSAPTVRTSRAQPAASVAATAPPAAAAPAPPAAAGANPYTVIASRNLFSPTRTEAPPPPPTPPAAAVVAPVLPKPNLFGVVLQDGAPVAYLEDPVSKRVARYRVGDSVAGGTVKNIGSDTVMLMRPEGEVTVRLHDPTRPKPAAPAQPTPTPSTPGAAPVAPSRQMPTPTPTPQGVMPEGRPTITTPRRPLVPGVLGRIPPQPNDASSEK